MRVAMWLALVWSWSLAIDLSGPQQPVPPPLELSVDVWTDRGERAVYFPGERIRVYFRTSRDAFVVVYDVDTDGRVKLLFPRDPWSQTMVEGGVTHTIPPVGAPWDLRIGGPVGIEYVVAVASTEPFQWEEYADQLSAGVVLETITTDPYLGMERFNQLIAPLHEGVPFYVSDHTVFYVERRVPYPRYMCYDCHRPWRWDPYYAVCPAFEIVIYTRYEDYYCRPPANPWGRRPYYWYKRKTNREYPHVKYKYASGSEFWGGKTRTWSIPDGSRPVGPQERLREPRGDRGGPERGKVPSFQMRQKQTEPRTPAQRPGQPQAPRVQEPSKVKEPQGQESTSPGNGGEQRTPRFETRPFYRAKEPRTEGSRTEQGSDSSRASSRERQR